MSNPYLDNHYVIALHNGETAEITIPTSANIKDYAKIRQAIKELRK